MRDVALLTFSLALVVFAGCTAGPVGTTGSPTTSATTSSTPVFDEPCTEYQRAPVDPVRDHVEPSDLPERPEALTRSNVRSYITAYERAYARNEALTRTSTRVETYVGDVQVEETPMGWVVTLESVTNTWAAGTETADGSPTVIHGDGPRLPVRYWLTEDRLVRAAAEYGGTPSVAAGRDVECF